MKKIFPVVLALAGLAFLVGGVYAANRGLDAKDQVTDTLVAQQIVTPEDASIPNQPVDDPETAVAMAEIINTHALGDHGLTYAQMGRFVSAANPDDPAGTSDESQALMGDNGKPVANPARTQALTAANLQTSLYSSAMAFNLSYLVIGLGIMIATVGVAFIGLGVALSGLVFPSLARRFHVRPVTA